MLDVVFFSLLLLLVFVLIIWLWLECDPYYWKRKGIPHSLPLPIFGNSIEALYKPLHQLLLEKYKIYGHHKYYGIHLFGKPVLIVHDAELTNRMLTTDGEYFLSHGVHCNQNCDTLGKGLFFVDGEQWRQTRQKMSPYFTPLRIKSMVNLVEPLAEQFAQMFVKKANSSPVEALDVCHKYTTDIIVASTFGTQPDCMSNPHSFFNDLNRAFTFNFMYKNAVSMLLPRLYDYLNLIIIPTYYDNKIKGFLKDAIELRRTAAEERNDFLQGMVELMDKESQETKGAKKFNLDGTSVARFDIEGVMAQCMMLYAAGSDTTSSALASLLYELALNQTIQNQIRDEIQSVLEDDNIQLCHLSSLVYTNHALDETLRKYSILAMVPRKCIKPYKLDGFTIDAGTLVHFNSCGMQRDPKYFPQPELFQPERFETPENIVSGSYIPFGMGSRTCIGLKFARVAILMALCKLLRHHRVIPSSKTAVPMQLSFSSTMAPKNLWLLVQPM